MEREIGEIFKINGIYVQCIESKSICQDCLFIDTNCWDYVDLGRCDSTRTDKKNVIFKRL